jgi:hypothetical protein
MTQDDAGSASMRGSVANDWIPVESSLPETFIPVLVWFASPASRLCKYAEVTHRGVAGDWQHSHRFDKPTHWMKLPAPPTDGK